MSILLGSVVCTPQNPRPCESVRIEAFDSDGQSLEQRQDVQVYIHGVPGAIQYLQFPTSGTYPLTVYAQGSGVEERQVLHLVVSGDSVTFTPVKKPQKAVMSLRQSQFNPYEVMFTIGTENQKMSAMPNLDFHVIPGISKFNNVLSTVSGATANVPVTERRIKGPAKAGNWSAQTGLLNMDSGNVKDLLQKIKAGVKEKYVWDFGDGVTLKTSTPQVVHNYSDTMNIRNKHRSFHVKCQLVNEGVEVVRTLTIHSAYAQCKALGFIVPCVKMDIFASKELFWLVGTLEVFNVEDEPLTLNKQGLVFHTENPDDVGQPKGFKTLASSITIAPNSSTLISANVPISEAHLYQAPGFTVYYAGSTPGGVPVRVTATFEIRKEDRDSKPFFPFPHEEESRPVWPWEEIEKTISELVRNPRLQEIIGNEAVTVDRETGSIAVSLAGKTRGLKQEKIRSLVDPVLMAAVIPNYLPSAELGKTALSTRKNAEMNRTGIRGLNLPPSPPPPPGPIVEGQVCDPDNLTTEEQTVAEEKQLVCQLTTEEIEVKMPARFMNARKGDIILSPGGAGLIGSLLLKVDPPQLYSHSGIMTRNFDEITHSTASETRMMDYLLGNQGSDGIQPRVLKYMWPGVVTQSIEGAVHGESFMDPENGKAYSISSFSPNAIGFTHNDRFEIVYPLVVKPDPLQETTQVRSKLHVIANDAKGGAGRPGVNSKSHYRLYCYTDPTIGLSTTAPADAGWAAGTFPSVCSSFLWMILHKKGLHMETGTQYVMPTDLESGDVSQGAFVNPATPNGLYTYTASERLAGAEWLYDELYHKVYDQAGWLGNLLTDAADDVGNQIVNTFANDNANGKDSDAWRTSIQDANAVSPQNILWWDLPQAQGYYGYAEPLIYRESRIEKYTLSRWKLVLNHGNIMGKVTLDGIPIAGATVQVYEGKTTFSGPDGNYTLTKVPLGSYMLKAWKVIEGTLYSAQQTISLNTATLTVNVELQPPDERYRLAQIYLDFWGRDEEWMADDEIHDPGPEYFELPLGPDLTVNTLTRQYKWGGEIRVEYTITLRLLVGNTIDVEVSALLYEGTTEGNSDLDGQGLISFNVPLAETKAAILSVTNTDEDDGDQGLLTLTVKNARNTN